MPGGQGILAARIRVGPFEKGASFMAARSLPALWVLLALLFLSVGLMGPQAQSQTNGWHYLRPVASSACQAIIGPDAQQDPTIGLAVAPSGPGGPLKVTEIAPRGPAGAAGIRLGDLLWGSDEGGNPTVIDACELRQQVQSSSSGASPLILFHESPGQSSRVQVSVVAEPRREVYPDEAQFPTSAVLELVGGGRFQAGATLAQGPHGDFELRLSVQNLGSDTLLRLDEQKVFLLGANGEQLTQYGYSEWRRSIENLIGEATALAQGMEPLSYVAPPPPPPPTHYDISGTANGAYTITPMGNNTYQTNGQSQIDYTVSPYYTSGEQMAQAAGSIAAIIEDIRIARANKKIKDLRKKAQADAEALKRILAAGVAAHLDTTQPIAPGGIRAGSVEFLPSTPLSSSTVKAVFVVNDSSAQKDYFVTFEFRP